MTFGDFRVDTASGELWRNGERVKLQDLPFRVLVLLLVKAGDVVTRDELRAGLWGAETFVDAEAGLNTAINKLREALGDTASAPRFIETLPKRGYRFIGPIDRIAETTPAAPPAVAQAESPIRRERFRLSRLVAGLLVVAAVSAAAFGVWRWRMTAHRTVIAVVAFHNETGDAQYDRLAQSLTDATVVALAGNPRYAVIGNAAILRTPRIFADIKAIGDALHAEYLVLGQVQSAGGTVTVRTHFIRTSDQTHLWATGIPGEGAGLDTRVSQTVAAGVNRVLKQ